MLLSSLALLALLTSAPEPVIHSVEIRGTPVPVTLETRKGEALKPDALTHDIHALWATGRFSDVQVERAETPEGVDVVFLVTEAPQLRLRKFEFDPNGDRLPIRLESGAPVDEHAVAGLGAKLRQRLVEDGHPGAQVTTDLVPAGPGQADVHVKLESGPREVVREVRFSGDLGIDEKDLLSAMRATRVKRILPKIWKREQPYSDAAIQSDLARLRSLYISRGHLDAQVRLDDVERSDGKVALTVNVKAGPRFGIRNSEMIGTDTNVQTALGLTGAFSGRDLCACLFKARRSSEKEGRLDFNVQLRTDDVDAPLGLAPGDSASLEKWVDLSARVSTGPQYRIGRIEFRGNHSFTDSTVRRVFKLDEGDLLDPDLLRRSVGRINKMGLFETVNGDQVYVIRDPETGTADVRVALKELPRGRWYLSGPAGPISVGGPLQAAVTARLPGWGSGILEASTYFLSFGLSSWAKPVAGMFLFGGQKKKALFPLVFLERPFLEGQRWASGFVLSPQLGWQSMLMGYGMTQAQRRLKNLLIPDAVQPDLTAALQRYRPGQDPFETGTLLCEAPKPRWRVARIIAGFAIDFALSSPF